MGTYHYISGMRSKQHKKINLEIGKAIIYISLVILFGVSIVFLTDKAQSISYLYYILISIYLGVDIASTFMATNNLPNGRFKPIKTNRYILSEICSLSLFALSYYVNKIHSLQDTGLSANYLSSVILIGVFYLGGLEGNKIFTGFSKEYLESLSISDGRGSYNLDEEQKKQEKIDRMEGECGENY